MNEGELEADDPETVIHDEDVVYQINTFGADFDIDGLIRRFDKGVIYRPEFQRNFVWTLPQASKFIESILLGLPIPSVFLYREDSTQKNLIVDGLQRLTTLHAFHKGYFPSNDRVFKLKDVKKRYEGLSFNELDPEDQRRFEDAIIHAMIIQQTSPNDDNSSVYHIFERLNSNGTPLQPQEMRAAIYHGPFLKMLSDLNKNEKWRLIFGKEHKRAKDQELILRFFSLLHNRGSYSMPMKLFLNKYISDWRNINDDDIKKHKAIFETNIGRVYDALGDRAFRPSTTMNVAVFDSFLIAVTECPDANSEKIKLAYEELLNNEEYIKYVNDTTSSVSHVDGRINLAIANFNDTT